MDKAKRDRLRGNLTNWKRYVPGVHDRLPIDDLLALLDAADRAEAAEASIEEFKKLNVQLAKEVIAGDADLLKRAEEAESRLKDYNDIAYDAEQQAESYKNAASVAEHRAESLQRFKDWVHARLDAAGVPHDPEPEHTKEHGCRISGRMNWLFNQLEETKNMVCFNMREYGRCDS